MVTLAIAGYVLAGWGSGGSSASSTGSTHTGSSTPKTSTSDASSGSTPTSTSSPPPKGSFTMTAVGDTMLGNTPDLPPSPSTYFNAVEAPLTQGADIVFGNLEGTLTNATAGKCGSDSTNCFQFHAPPSYAGDLKTAGFTIMNNANNHSYDFGAVGQADTVKALHRAGIAQTGLPGQITVVKANGIKVAYIGFAPYSDTASLLDIPAAEQLVHKATTEADVVVVYDARGRGGHRVPARERPGGDLLRRGSRQPEGLRPRRHQRGADLVIASGPHVLRGMEFFHHHLIAYSLGNFAGYSNYSIGGELGVTCILRVKLTGAGKFVSASITPATMVGEGQPILGGPAVSQIAALSQDDFGGRAASISGDGTISPPS